MAAKSIEHVLQNKGARTPGVDGKTKDDFKSAQARLCWQRAIIRSLRSDTFQPQPTRRVYIDKPGKPGQKRPLGIPPLDDRVVQDMLRRVLEPIFESRFHPHSYGFRPYRSTHHAVQRVCHLIQMGYTWVVEGDIKGFFDHVNHDTLLRLVQREVGDPRILRLIRAFLKAGVLEDGSFQVTEEGTPQGGLISPLFGNVYLNELDWFIARRYEVLTQYQRQKQPFGCFICRYADDFVLLVRGTRQDAETLKNDVAEFLRQELQLELAADKTLVTHVDDGFDFLGFNIRRFQRNGRRVVLAQPSKKAQTKFRQNVRKLTRGIGHHDGNLWIMDLNEYLSGWAEYFRRGNSKRTFTKLDHILWWMIFRRMRKRWSRSRTRMGFRAFLRDRLIPYRFDTQHPRYRHYTARNFGHWIDSSKTAAFIVDHLSYYPIRHAPLHTQLHPYTPQGRAKVEELRKAKRLVSDIAKLEPLGHSNMPKVYGLLNDWLVKNRNRCTSCQRQLTKADVRQLRNRLMGRLRHAYKGTVSLRCKTCSASM